MSSTTYLTHHCCFRIRRSGLELVFHLEFSHPDLRPGGRLGLRLLQGRLILVTRFTNIIRCFSLVPGNHCTLGKRFSVLSLPTLTGAVVLAVVVLHLSSSEPTFSRSEASRPTFTSLKSWPYIETFSSGHLVQGAT